MATGKVKWFDRDRGFGFIEQNDGGPDAYVHFSAIQAGGFKELHQGDHVEYDVTQGLRGPKAENVTKL